MSNNTPRYGIGDASYQAAGGQAGIRQLVDEFYDVMDSLPEAQVIRQMHPQDLTESRQKLAFFLCGWLGGPRLFAEHYGPIHIPMAHARFPIAEAERDAWLLCMQHALAKQSHYAADFNEYLMLQLAVPAERIRQASQQVRQ